MLLAFTLPSVDLRLLGLLECKQEIISSPKEPIRLLPTLSRKSSKHIARLILNNKYRIIIIPAPFKHRYKTRAVLTKTKNTGPGRFPHITW